MSVNTKIVALLQPVHMRVRTRGLNRMQYPGCAHHPGTCSRRINPSLSSGNQKGSDGTAPGDTPAATMLVAIIFEGVFFSDQNGIYGLDRTLNGKCLGSEARFCGYSRRLTERSGASPNRKLRERYE